MTKNTKINSAVEHIADCGPGENTKGSEFEKCRGHFVLG